MNSQKTGQGTLHCRATEPIDPVFSTISKTQAEIKLLSLPLPSNEFSKNIENLVGRTMETIGRHLAILFKEPTLLPEYKEMIALARIALIAISTQQVSSISVNQILNTARFKQFDINIYTPYVLGRVCGVNDANFAFCSTSTNNLDSWYRLPGKFTQITVAKGRMFGIGLNNDIYYSASEVDGSVQWVRLNGGLKQISFDGTTICGTNFNDYIWCANAGITTAPQWFLLPGRLKQVIVRGLKLVGINSNNQIFYASNYNNPNWIQISGGLRQISYDGTYICGTNTNNDVFCSATAISNPTAPAWQKLSGKMRSAVVTGENTLVGVAATNPCSDLDRVIGRLFDNIDACSSCTCKIPHYFSICESRNQNTWYKTNTNLCEDKNPTFAFNNNCLGWAQTTTSC